MGASENIGLPDFQVFIKPVGSWCNLGCKYCYYSNKPGAGSSGYPKPGAGSSGYLKAGAGSSGYLKTEAGSSGHHSEAGSPGYFTGKGVMSFEILERLVRQQIEAALTSTVVFSWHGGEPLLAGIEFFRSAVELQKKHCPRNKKILNGIQTNGTLINEEWAGFLAEENFMVGLSMDGPDAYHDRYRQTKNGQASFKNVLEGFDLLVMNGIEPEILCVVNSVNSRNPVKIYDFFRQLGVTYLTFIPLVEKTRSNEAGSMSVSPAAWGKFLCEVFDEWTSNDIGKIKVRIFEEALRTAFHQEHSLCIFRRKCGRVPVIEQNGDFYSCDHYVNPDHFLGNIRLSEISELLRSEPQISFGNSKADTLPVYCLNCEVLEMCNGECPKNRFIKSPDGQIGLNYLCEGYRRFFNHCRPMVEAVKRVTSDK